MAEPASERAPGVASPPAGSPRTPGRADDPTAPFPPIGDEARPPSFQVRLFGSHAYFRLWGAQVVSSLGDWIGLVAIVALAGRVGGSGDAAAVSLVLSARLVPGFFLSQVAGVLVDRLDRKKVMVACDVGRGCVLATLPFIDSVWGLVLASFLLEVGTLLWSPAKDATVPNLVPADHLTTVNSLSLVAAYGTFPVASLVFAGLAKFAEWLGRFEALDFLELNRESIAIYFDVGTFFVSALMIASLPLVRRPRAARAEGTPRVDFGEIFRDLKEGWHFIFINPIVRAVMLALGTGLIGGGMMVPLGEKFSDEVAGAGPAGFGLLLTALGFGVGAGVLLLSALQRRVPKAKVFTLAVFVSGAALTGAAAMSSLAPALGFTFVVGVCAGAVYVLGFTILQENVEDELRGRTFATLYTLVRFCLLLSFALGPLLAGAFDSLSRARFDEDRTVSLGGLDVFLPGVRLALWLAALIMMVAGGLALISLRHGERQAQQRAVEPKP